MTGEKREATDEELGAYASTVDKFLNADGAETYAAEAENLLNATEDALKTGIASGGMTFGELAALGQTLMSASDLVAEALPHLEGLARREKAVGQLQFLSLTAGTFMGLGSMGMGFDDDEADSEEHLLLNEEDLTNFLDTTAVLHDLF